MLKKNLIRVVIFEVIALVLINLALLALGKPLSTSILFTVGTTTIATLWNFAYNTGFDLLNLPRAGIKNRIQHTFGFQVGMITFASLFYAFMYSTTFIEGVLFNIPLSGFFFLYSLAFNAVFDTVWDKFHAATDQVMVKSVGVNPVGASV